MLKYNVVCITYPGILIITVIVLNYTASYFVTKIKRGSGVCVCVCVCMRACVRACVDVKLQVFCGFDFYERCPIKI